MDIGEQQRGLAGKNRALFCCCPSIPLNRPFVFHLGAFILLFSFLHISANLFLLKWTLFILTARHNGGCKKFSSIAPDFSDFRPLIMWNCTFRLAHLILTLLFYQSSGGHW